MTKTLDIPFVITQEEVSLYIQNIPPAPSVLRQTLEYLRDGDLPKAAKCAEEDPALKLYLKTLINRPIYGFRNEVSDLNQIFSILGISTTQQILYSYLLSLLLPKQWSLFTLTDQNFYDLQASLGRKWEKILKHLGLHNRDTESAITLLPASIIVCDALFGAHAKEVAQLRSVKALDYNTILIRLSKRSLFDLCSEIALKWEMSPSIAKIVHAASGTDSQISGNLKLLAQWMHLLLFYELSQSAYVSAGLNEFIDFQIDFVQDIYESFMQVVDDETSR
ncbi:MAG: HDOD domain-containing protein [Sulfuricurvum sp.]|uniref:HDOD domain-containing protein n=1 Tax=Sulfuricurvum sp. TaxID=2025608 RepID=UPI0025D835CE|nr:HDOD domain-containing protein [Sulfuricurvum sp.]MCK9374379.1 HDOD domain-containing protein [Sulfuricurvum sp.]